ncbi:MAG: hypothetical protein ACR2PX_10255 [Endozoicomonas sp.]|uniref:hypothetical protein n=1 Tax=Endozoicomonas sp. TaxID=1892382 RepID=UPI003D9B8756
MQFSSEGGCILPKAFSALFSELSSVLSKDEFQLLELKANNTPYRTIAVEFDSTAYAVRRQLDALLSRVSRQHSADLFEFAWVLDLALDDYNGESDFKSMLRRLNLKRPQIKFLILLTRNFVKHPVEHYKNRIFRIKLGLSYLP